MVIDVTSAPHSSAFCGAFFSFQRSRRCALQLVVAVYWTNNTYIYYYYHYQNYYYYYYYYHYY